MGQLDSADTLTIGGDLCDFWFASREVQHDPMECQGLAALADFVQRGCKLTIVRGNHDAWLDRFYERQLGAQVLDEPVILVSHGQRIHLVHGHLVTTRSWWKKLLESRLFLEAFSLLPRPVALLLRARLDRANRRDLARRTHAHEAIFRQYVQQHIEHADVFLFGHIHQAVDERIGPARMIILGDWIRRASYLRIDEGGASFVVES